MTLFDKAKSAMQQQLPFVLYAKPNADELQAFFQDSDELYKFNQQEGFVFASFDGKNQVIFPINKSEFLTEKIKVESKSSPDVSFDASSKNDQENFENLVEKAVFAIKNEGFEKIVVSRKIDFKTEVAIFETYKNILHTYKSAFRYLVFHPKVGTWTGASPEQLLQINNLSFETVSLAGTQVVSNNIQWSEKEIKEQQMVTDYIVSKCKSITDNVKVSAPFNEKAGALVHIKTDIKGMFAKKSQAFELLTSLHPTPAICGLPTYNALQFIQENERYDRKFYSGFLGEWNVDNNTDLFVNLRCMEIGNMNSIYVGCGITVASNAAAEFIETENKSKTMKEVVVGRF